MKNKNKDSMADRVAADMKRIAELLGMSTSMLYRKAADKHPEVEAHRLLVSFASVARADARQRCIAFVREEARRCAGPATS